MNLPLTGAVFAVTALFVNLKVPGGTIREKLGRMDWYVEISRKCSNLAHSLLRRTGNSMFIPSITYASLQLY
jgi:hypothetical protein